MAYASYRLHRIGWVAWRWVADYRGEVGGKGVALTERAARSAARAWLQAKADAEGSVAPGGPESASPPSIQPDAPRPHPVVRARAPERPLRDKAAQTTFGRRAARPAQYDGVGAS